MKKQYYNKTTNEWYTEGQTITRILSDGALFSGVPSVEQLNEWGFEKWHDSEPTPEELLEMAKVHKIAELEAYDQSESVNSFTIGNHTMWLNVGERQQVATQISASEAIGRNTMTRWFEGQEYIFPLETWKQMLVALEVYAGDALNVTEKHKSEINLLETLDDVEAYNITTGYPEKLHF